MRYVYRCSVFFFQAEDGIRDLTVTGVQTCALPIFGQVQIGQHVGQEGEEVVADGVPEKQHAPRATLKAGTVHRIRATGLDWREQGGKIGRASCRERV